MQEQQGGWVCIMADRYRGTIHAGVTALFCFSIDLSSGRLRDRAAFHAKSKMQPKMIVKVIEARAPGSFGRIDTHGSEKPSGGRTTATDARWPELDRLRSIQRRRVEKNMTCLKHMPQT
jgi:hypothetical protein